MRIRIAVISAVFLLAGHVLAEQSMSKTDNEKAVAEVLAVNERLTAAALASDMVVFHELLSEDFVVSDPSNTIRHRDELISLFANSEVVYRSIDMTIDYAEALGDLVVIMGTESTILDAVPEGSPQGPGVTLHRRFTNIFRKENGNWRLLIKQSTTFSTEE